MAASRWAGPTTYRKSSSAPSSSRQSRSTGRAPDGRSEAGSRGKGWMDSIRRMVIDSHVHFWDPTALSYPWIGQVYALRRPFLPADFAALSEDRLDGIIVVEANSAAADAPAEVEFLAELATREPRIMGIVVFLDVTDHATLDATLPALARRDAVVGVRHNVQGTPRGYCLTSTFVRGVRRVAAERLTFDLCIT